MGAEYEDKEELNRLVSTPDNFPSRELAQDLWRPEVRRQGSPDESEARNDTCLVAQAGRNTPRESFGINKIDNGGTYEELRPHASTTIVRADSRCKDNVVSHMVWQNDDNGKLQYVDFEGGKIRLQKAGDGRWYFYQRDAKGTYSYSRGQGTGYSDCAVSTSTGQVRLIDSSKRTELHIPINGPGIFMDFKSTPTVHRKLRSLQSCITGR